LREKCERLKKIIAENRHAEANPESAGRRASYQGAVQLGDAKPSPSANRV